MVDACTMLYLAIVEFELVYIKDKMTLLYIAVNSQAGFHSGLKRMAREIKEQTDIITS